MSSFEKDVEYRERALAAEDAIRQLVGWVLELDRDPIAPAGYVTGRAQGAVRLAMRNVPRPKKRLTLPSAGGGR